MKNKLFLSLALFFAMLFAGAFFAKAASASPRLYLDPSSATVAKGAEFEIKVVIDAESNSVFGSDAVITFPAADVDYKSFTKGNFFSTVSDPALSSGRLELHGYFSALYDSKSGSGTFITLKFQAKQDSGSGAIAFVCTGSGTDTQILNADGNNILNCGSLNQTNLTYSTTSTTVNSCNGTCSTNADCTSDLICYSGYCRNSGCHDAADCACGAPKACGGNCGSNGDCQSGLFCYQNSCRNPSCQTDTDCTCPTATPTPTKKPASSSKPSPTPEIVVLNEYATPSAETQTPTPTAEQASSEKKLNPKNIVIGILIFIILAIIGFIVSKMKKSNTPPQNPPSPTNFLNVEPPIPPVQNPTPPMPPNTPPAPPMP